jgi:predicted NAD-dependent protein-ADP-ribosyltransferase YbiA (DUF1768 family)
MKFIFALSVLFAAFTSCATTSAPSTTNEKNYLAMAPESITKGADGYPDHWWKEVPKEQLAGWEISPHMANRAGKEVILSKRNELGKLSNFHPAEFTLDGLKFASIEGLWQALKYPEGPNDERAKDPSIVWPHTREQVMMMSAFEAKRAGEVGSANMKKLGIKWVTYRGEKIEYGGADKMKHYDIMLRASRAKVAAHADIKEVLLQTGDLKLLPDHKTYPDSPPAYHYYDIYMKIRGEYQNNTVNK